MSDVTRMTVADLADANSAERAAFYLAVAEEAAACDATTLSGDGVPEAMGVGAETFTRKLLQVAHIRSDRRKPRFRLHRT